MDVLIVEPLEPEVLQWIGARHTMRFAPELDRDARALRQALFNVHALIAPPSVTLDAQALKSTFTGLLEQARLIAPRYQDEIVTRSRGIDTRQLTAMIGKF